MIQGEVWPNFHAMVLFRVLLSVYLVVSCATIIPAQNGKVGINTTTPTTTLDVAGKIRIDNDTTAAQAGMIRWNADKEDFEGYNGTDWLSLTKSSSTWGTIAWKEAVEDFKTTGTTLEQFSHYGQSVAIDGDYAIVGAPGDKVGNNTGQGSAFIYHRDGDAWVQVQQLTASNGGAGHWFGYSVDLSGNYAIVSAPYYGGSAGRLIFFTCPVVRGRNRHR